MFYLTLRVLSGFLWLIFRNLQFEPSLSLLLWVGVEIQNLAGASQGVKRTNLYFGFRAVSFLTLGVLTGLLWLISLSNHFEPSLSLLLWIGAEIQNSAGASQRT